MAGEQFPNPMALTKAFYDQDPRATQLRDLCMHATDIMEAYVANEDVLDQVFDLNSILHDSGIEPGMHAVATDDPEAKEKLMTFYRDPVKAAEWAAGQVCDLFTDMIDYSAHADPTEPVTDGESDEEDTDTHLSTRDQLDTLRNINAIRWLIDYSETNYLLPAVEVSASHRGRTAVISMLVGLAVSTALGVSGILPFPGKRPESSTARAQALAQSFASRISRVTSNDAVKPGDKVTLSVTNHTTDPTITPTDTELSITDPDYAINPNHELTPNR